MTDFTVCRTALSDCPSVPDCKRHACFWPEGAYTVGFWRGDSAESPCPGRLPPVEDDGFQTMYVSQGANR